MLTRSLLLSTTLAAGLAGLAAPAAAQTVTLRDLFNLDRLATFAGQWAITTLRGVADVTYAHLDISPLSGRMVLTGLAVCALRAARMPFHRGPGGDQHRAARPDRLRRAGAST